MKKTKPIDPNEFFREVTLRICSSLDINEALRATTDYLKAFIPVDQAGLYYLVEEQFSIYGVADQAVVNTSSRELHSTPIFTFTPEEMKRIEAAAPKQGQKGEVVIYDCRDIQHPHYAITKKYSPHLIDYSFINLLLRIKEHEVGMFCLWAKGPNRYNEYHAELLKSVREPVAISFSNASRYQEMVSLKEKLAADNRAVYRDLERYSGNQVIGADFGLRGVMEHVHQVAPMSSTVLLLGETGSGKEVIANAIFMASKRRNQPFVRVQCGAIPETLLDSELFGHERGAFTGAISTKRGRFERADGGTIFLDEIAELTPEAQVKLLHVLQEKEFERLGGTSIIKTDVRVIAATHRDLQQMVKEGRFREDLWFRLNVFPLHLPPLRERKQDIPSLVQFFIEQKSREMNLPRVPSLDHGVMEQLQTYNWPGNVRELQNIIERALILNQGTLLRIQALDTPAKISTPVENTPLPSEFLALNYVTAEHIKRVLSLTNGRIEGRSGAAELLQINHGTLRARLKKLGIPYGRNAERYVTR